MALIACRQCGKDVARDAKTCPACGADRPGDRTIDTVIRAIPVIVIVALVWWVFGGTGLKTPDASPPPPAASSTSAADRAWLATDPPEARAVIGAITSAGYECAALALLRRRGPSPYGEKFEALCGPADGSGSGYINQHYAVYPDKALVHLCARFGDLSQECS